jgi:hypothetical protein
MVVLNGQKGVISVYLGSKPKHNFLNIFGQFFYKKWKNYFWGMPKNFLALTDFEFFAICDIKIDNQQWAV